MHPFRFLGRAFPDIYLISEKGKLKEQLSVLELFLAPLLKDQGQPYDMYGVPAMCQAPL